MSTGRRFDTYLAGSFMLLLGLLLAAYLLGLISASRIAPLTLVGVGVIFSILAVMKSKSPAKYEMTPRVTLAYGILAVVIGTVWIAGSVEIALAGYVLAAALIFFGLLFIAYTRLRPSKA